MRSVADAQGAIESATAGAAMAAATEVLGDLGYIDLTFTANAETKLAGVGSSRRKTADSTPAMPMR